MFSTIDWHIEDQIGHLVLNQPPTNKMNLVFFEELDTLTREIIPATDLRGMLVYGKGRHFSSGAELKDIVNQSESTSETEEMMFQRLCVNNRSFVNIYNLQIPVISVIKGVCLGSAFELALFSHFRFCSPEAIMGLPEVTFDLMPGCGGTQRLTQIVGKGKSMQMILSGNSVMADEALQLNLVDKIIAKAELHNFSLNFMNALAQGYSVRNIPFYKKRYL